MSSEIPPPQPICRPIDPEVDAEPDFDADEQEA